MKPKNAFYAQSGGVTAVINASAAGVIETARRHRNRIGKVYAGRDGIIGALTEDLIDTSREPASAISRLKTTPGGAFGSCRYKLKGIDESRAHYERLIEVFRAHDIGYFFYNGGNDSADTAVVEEVAGVVRPEYLDQPLVMRPTLVDAFQLVTARPERTARCRLEPRDRRRGLATGIDQVFGERADDAVASGVDLADAVSVPARGLDHPRGTRVDDCGYSA